MKTALRTNRLTRIRPFAWRASIAVPLLALCLAVPSCGGGDDDEAVHPVVLGGAIITYAVDGELLTTSGFARLVTPNDVRAGRFVSNLISIEVFAAPAAP